MPAKINAAVSLLFFNIVSTAILFGCNMLPQAVDFDNADHNSEEKTLKVALVSSHSKFCDVEENLRRFESIIKKASARGAKLVCFPELALTSYTNEPEIFQIAEKIPGPLSHRLVHLSAKYNVYLSMGMPEKKANKYYITQVIVGPDGYIGKYRKHHLVQREQGHGFSPGQSFPVFEIEAFRLGVNICFDGRHRDTIEAMRKARVDVIHHPHGNSVSLGADAEEWTRGKMVYCAERAIHSRAYILINNSAGDTPRPDGTMLSFAGGAIVIDPLGQVVTRTLEKDRSEKMIFATLTKPLSAMIPDFEMKKLKDFTISETKRSK